MFLFQPGKTVCCLVFIWKYSSWKHLKTHRVLFLLTLKKKRIKKPFAFSIFLWFGYWQGPCHLHMSLFPLHEHNPVEKPYHINIEFMVSQPPVPYCFTFILSQKLLRVKTKTLQQKNKKWSKKRKPKIRTKHQKNKWRNKKYSRTLG